MHSHAKVFEFGLAHVPLVSDGEDLEEARLDSDSAELREGRSRLPNLSVECVAETISDENGLSS